MKHTAFICALTALCLTLLVDQSFAASRRKRISIAGPSVVHLERGKLSLVNLDIRNGKPPYTVTISPETTLPAGLSVGSDGALSGTPELSQDCRPKIQVTDAKGKHTSRYIGFGISGETYDLSWVQTPGQLDCDYNPAIKCSKFTFTVTHSGVTMPLSIIQISLQENSGPGRYLFKGINNLALNVGDSYTFDQFIPLSPTFFEIWLFSGYDSYYCSSSKSYHFEKTLSGTYAVTDVTPN